eukprot:670437-Prorocentrum_lima.AAC.1
MVQGGVPAQEADGNRGENARTTVELVVRRHGRIGNHLKVKRDTLVPRFDPKHQEKGIWGPKLP